MAPTSPAKRVTRARAAKASTIETNEPPKKVLAAKVAGVRKTKAPSKEEGEIDPLVEIPTKKATSRTATNNATITAAPRRRVKVTPLTAPAVEEVDSNTIEVVAPEKPTRAKKVGSKVESKTVREPISKPPTKKAASEKIQDEVKSVPKTRGRPKKAAVEVPESATEKNKPVRQTRKRAASEAESANTTAVTATKTSALPKKKVTFQGLPEDDKENQPMPTKRGVGKKEPASASGLRARPVRKPTATATRKRAAPNNSNTQPPRALTPKKITQVARSSTPLDSDEDELNGGKTPVRDLSLSPKRNPLGVRSPSPIKKLDFTQTLTAASPMKTSIMSPPRRLPQSPYKNSLKDSPKRGEGIPVFPTLTATLGVSATGATNSQAEAALQQSPKRGILDSSIFSQSVAKLQKSPAKPFLSQSPVRRLFSPLKQTATAGAPNTVEVTETAASSYFKSSQSPIRSAKVHRMSDEELTSQKGLDIDFDQSIINVRSPIKLTKILPVYTGEGDEAFSNTTHVAADTIASPATPRGPWSKAEEAQFAPADEDELAPEGTEHLEQADPVAELEQPDLPLTTNAATYLLNPYSLRSDDESSEDELQADKTPQRPLFGGRPSLSTKAFSGRLSSAFARDTGSNLGFTPLATQLSGWLASSPAKNAKGPTHTQEVMFSPLAAEHVPGEVQISRQATPVQPKSTSSRKSTGLEKSVASRPSLATSVASSPVASSYFADEMAARDIEQHLESRVSVGVDDMHLDHGTTEPEQSEIEALPTVNDTDLFLENVNEDDADVENDQTDALSTTGVLEEMVMTDTAMLDFVNIAQEAEALAPTLEEAPSSTDSSEYGDENTVIITRQNVVPSMDLLEPELQSATKAEVPEKDMHAEVVRENDESIVDFNTPVRPDLSQPRFVNTVVSKVPLRPEGQVSPIKNPKKRSRSLSAGPGSSKKPLLNSGIFSIPKSNTVISLSPVRQAQSPAQSIAAGTPGQVSFAASDFGDSTLDGIDIPDESDDEIDDSVLSKLPCSIKSSRIRSTVATPARTPLKAVGTGVLHGAVVYVDVHTTEGADASGIFVDLLTQMGAKCVREWKWNPRAIFAAEHVESMATPARIGISHVVYKDGGKRTLEKVRDAKGEVCCVGVAWVLDCEREGKWLDESTYAINTNIVPRGGSRRRKSMEPRALINANGSVSAARGRSISGEMTKEMRDELIHTPVRRPLSPLANSMDVANEDDNEDQGSPESDVEAQAATPTGFVQYDPSTSMSPKTPYLMKEGAKLVQQSAPPKQIQQGLFPVSGRIEDQPDENTRNRLEAARRRTMNWRPRIASPLGK